MYENDLGWMYGTDTPVTLELTSGSPKKASGKGTRYDWPAYMNYSADAKIHIEGKSDQPLRPLLARMASWRRLPWNTRTVGGLCSPAMKALLRRLPLLLALLLPRSSV